MAERLRQEVSSLREELAVTTREHSSLLSTLNRDVDMLCEALYQGGNQLQLSDQVGRDVGEEDAPSSRFARAVHV